MVAAGALLGFGVVLSWVFAREFTDGTITGLFALPISRGRIALGKLVVYLLWTAAVGLAVTLEVLILGLLLGYGPPGMATWSALGRLLVLVVLTGIVAVPVAWVATAARRRRCGLCRPGSPSARSSWSSPWPSRRSSPL